MSRDALRRALAQGILYAIAVDLAAFAAIGLLKPQVPWPWDTRSTLAAGPLARFDSGWYASIAHDGYRWDSKSATGNIVFFPLYPLLIRGVANVSGISPFLAGSMLSHLFFFAGVAGLAVYFGEDPPEPHPNAVLFSLLAWPWAFFLLAMYAESLFLALAVSAFLAARRRSAAGVLVLGFFAGLTRIHALALVAPLAWIGMTSSPPRRHYLVGAALSPAVGVGAFLAWLGIRYGDPLVFFHAERAGWGRVTSSPLAGLFDTFSRAAANVQQKGFLHLGPLTDLIAPAFLLTTTLWLASERRTPEALYVGSGTLILILSGSLASSGRYALVLFPAFRLIGDGLSAQRRTVLQTMLMASLLFQLYLVARFVNNCWVA